MSGDGAGQGRARPDPPVIAALDDVTLAVRDLISASQDLTARMARRMGANVNDMRALLLLADHGPMGSAALARRLGMSSAATTILVDRLEAAGHLVRERDTADRRRVTVTDTDAARAALLDAWSPSIRALDEVCRSLPESEQAVARDLLGRLAAAMRGDHPGDERVGAAGAASD